MVVWIDILFGSWMKELGWMDDTMVVLITMCKSKQNNMLNFCFFEET